MNEKHTHADKMDGTDDCAECGKDIRNEIHWRLGEEEAALAKANHQ